jgi:hypothetical protein
VKYRINTKKYIGGQSGIIPKSIIINNEKQKIHFKDKITLGKQSINFSKMYEVYHDEVEEVDSNENAVVWKNDRMIHMTPWNGTTGPPGGAGGAGGHAAATTRVDVIDPHLLQMWRDIMHTTETAPRLTVCGGAGGGGGGGGMNTDNAIQAEEGSSPAAPTTQNNAVGSSGTAGGYGGRGQSWDLGGGDDQAIGGPGGGGSAGNGGNICIVTTTSSTPWTHNVARGTRGDAGTVPVGGSTGGTFPSNYSAADGGQGLAGKDFYIQI